MNLNKSSCRGAGASQTRVPLSRVSINMYIRVNLIFLFSRSGKKASKKARRSVSPLNTATQCLEN